MNISDIIALAGKILLVPDYYTTWEVGLSVAASILLAVIGVAGSKIAGFRLNCIGFIVLAIILVASFLWYWLYLYDKGGMFIWQTVCRAVFFLAFGVLMGSFGNAEKTGAGKGDGADDS